MLVDEKKEIGHGVLYVNVYNARGKVPWMQDYRTP